MKQSHIPLAASSKKKFWVGVCTADGSWDFKQVLGYGWNW